MGLFYYLLNGRLTFLFILSQFVIFTVSWHQYRLRLIQSHPDSGGRRSRPNIPRLNRRNEIGINETNIYYDHSNCVKSAIIDLMEKSTYSLFFFEKNFVKSKLYCWATWRKGESLSAVYCRLNSNFKYETNSLHSSIICSRLFQGQF